MSKTKSQERLIEELTKKIIGRRERCRRWYKLPMQYKVIVNFRGRDYSRNWNGEF